jgi:hypothetical protein
MNTYTASETSKGKEIRIPGPDRRRKSADLIERAGDFFGGIGPKARATTLTSKGDGVNVEFLRRLHLQEGETNEQFPYDQVRQVLTQMGIPP